MTSNRVQIVGALALLALAGCGEGQQTPAASTTSDNSPVVEAGAPPESSAAVEAPPASASTQINVPARLGPTGCGRPGGQIEDRRGSRAVADVSIGMTLEEALVAVACRSPIRLNNPRYPQSKTVMGSAGPVDVPSQEVNLVLEGHGGPTTREWFMLHVAGPSGDQRVVGIEGRLVYSADGMSREQVIEMLTKQYGTLTLQPQQTSGLTSYVAVEARDGSSPGAAAKCDSVVLSTDGCRRISTVSFITALPDQINVTITTQDNDYWASFAPK